MGQTYSFLIDNCTVEKYKHDIAVAKSTVLNPVLVFVAQKIADSQSIQKRFKGNQIEATPFKSEI
jgi:hypothetical protein